MGRQLFLHHYLPAHLASALVTGALLEFVFNIDPAGLDEPSYNTSAANVSGAAGGKKFKGPGGVVAAGRRGVPARERMGRQSLLAMWGAAGVMLAVVVGGWWFFLPLTYGKPGLDVEAVNARKWLGYDLHFAK